MEAGSDNIGVIDLSQQSLLTSSTETFGPMFIPSPLDSRTLRKNEQLYYLPPKPVVSYDGKIVSEILPLGDTHPQTNTQKFIQNTPQFGVFKGELPPPIPDQVQFKLLQQGRNTMRIEESRKRRFVDHKDVVKSNVRQSSLFSSSLLLITLLLSLVR